MCTGVNTQWGESKYFKSKFFNPEQFVTHIKDSVSQKKLREWKTELSKILFAKQKSVGDGC